MRITLLLAALLASAVLCAETQQVVVTAGQRTALRTGPSSDCDRITVLPPGIKLAVAGTKEGWHRVRLSATLDAFVAGSDVTVAPADTRAPHATVGNIATAPCEGGVALKVWLGQPVPFVITPTLAPAALRITLCGATLAHYGVTQPPGDDLCSAIIPRQVASDQVEIAVSLAASQPTGYTAAYTPDGMLTVTLRRPCTDGKLAGKVIALDPGHGGADSGACGPTGLHEKDCNLAIASQLASLLEKAGARVVLTRDKDTALSLGDRVAQSMSARPDLFLSIHNNAVGGQDPAKTAGIEVYYWTPMSIAPARCLLKGLGAELGTPIRFTCWRPFYVLRETDAPRVLVECAYVSNPAEEALLKTDGFRQRAALGLFSGIRSYFVAAAAGR